MMLILVCCLLLSACGKNPEQSTSGTTSAPTTAPTQQTTAPQVLTGWQQVGNAVYYYLEDGTKATGWVTVDDVRYYFSQEGILQTGWLHTLGGTYYLCSQGAMVTGWQEVDGVTYYFRENGILATGWEQIGDGRYYFDAEGKAYSGWTEVDGMDYYFRLDGAMATGWELIEENRFYFDAEGQICTGWVDVEEHRYYLGDDGVMVTGWLETEDGRFYLKEDGAMAKGCVEIDGVKNYFTSAGKFVILVNPWNYVPEGYEADLVYVDLAYSLIYGQVDRSCYENLIQMLKDCEAAGHKAVVISAYRTHEYQIKNHQRKVDYYLNLGYSQEEAYRLASMVVAVPGTSEHELGLAVDLVDYNNWALDESQASMPAQKWLMEHSWEYGFLLRYPTGKTDVTGIIYEPWHYRYVGVELATELHELGLTLEEYLQMLTEE